MRRNTRDGGEPLDAGLRHTVPAPMADRLVRDPHAVGKHRHSALHRVHRADASKYDFSRPVHSPEYRTESYLRQYPTVTADSVRLPGMKKNRDPFGDRLNALLDSEGFPAKGSGRQVLLGKAMGVSQKAARKWLEGEGRPQMQTSERIARRFHGRLEFLLTGRGPMRGGTAGVDADLLADVVEAAQKELESSRRQLAPKQFAAFVAALYEMSEGLPPDRRPNAAPILRLVHSR